ncbi:hypothetical protein BS78_02G358200 [Paspalum vaginatum]|nr:hypothetical protein BS78_02G358200 [Paspalum vaginatum]KAJ1291984.1 hypothetical protein BS78_02G358200 [Paspalum vaginatum]
MRTLFSFAGYTAVHIYLLGHMVLETPNEPKLAGIYRWIAALVFFFVGSIYFYTYSSLSSYVTHPSDWAAAAIFTLILFVAAIVSFFPAPQGPSSPKSAAPGKHRVRSLPKVALP